MNLTVSCADIEDLMILIHLYESGEVDERCISEVNMARFHLASCPQCFFIANKILKFPHEFCELLWEVPELLAQGTHNKKEYYKDFEAHVKQCATCNYWSKLIENNWENVEVQKIGVGIQKKARIIKIERIEKISKEDIQAFYDQNLVLDLREVDYISPNKLQRLQEYIKLGLDNKNTIKLNIAPVLKEVFQDLELANLTVQVIKEGESSARETAAEITGEFGHKAASGLPALEVQELRKVWEQIAGGLEHKESEMTYKGNYLSLNKKTIDCLPKITVSSEESSDNVISSQMENEAHLSESNFEIIRKIDQGGMGVIFEGRQNSLRRNIAIKQIIGASDTAKKEKFVAEALVTAYLDHPNIVPVHELGINDQEEIMLVMKKIGGISWKNLLHPTTSEEHKRASVYQLKNHLQILLNVCNAIAFAHNKGIIHNDLKPANVMVGEFGEVLVMDWGIAVDMYERLPQETCALHRSLVKKPMGTPCYMSPELAQGYGEEIGPWTDVYLLGAILYEILMGNPPHMEKTMWDCIYLASQGNMPDFSPDVPKELRDICIKAMNKASQDRYQNVSEFKEAIEGFSQHQESILISNKAQKILNYCQETYKTLQLNKQKIKEIERIQLYEKFSQVISYFQQALELWKENSVAIKGVTEARFAYALVALQNEDIGLASSQVTELGNLEQAEVLHQKIDKVKESRKRSQRINKRLQQSLVLAITAIIVVIVIALFAYKKVDGIWKQASQQLVHLTTQSTLRYLEPAIPYMQLTQKFAENGGIQVDFHPTTVNYFTAAIQSNRNFTWVSFGNDAGNYFAVHRNSKGLLNMTWRKQLPKGTQFQKFILDKKDSWQLSHQKMGNYDPRKRPWYKSAQKYPQGAWVAPFIFATEKKPGFMYTARSEKLKATWTVEYEISYLSDFLAKLKVGKQGRVYVITKNGKVVGHPKGEVTSKNGESIIYAHSHPDFMLREAWKNLQKEGSGAKYFTFDSYTAMVKPFPQESGIRWMVLLVTPTDEIFGDIHTEIWNMLQQASLFMLICFALFAICSFLVKKA